MHKRAIGSFILFATVVAAAAFAWVNRYSIYDWERLRNYSAPPAIAQLATGSGMNDYGRTLFYVNYPQISDRNSFNGECKTTEQTIVLGCYTGSRIYIFDVSNPQLNGVEEVTAAHEMLHAAYERLSGSEKAYVDQLIEAAYRRVNDPHLTEVMASYQKTEPGQQDNELHSILGTEYANLGAPLEAYYGKYFSDRSKVVDASNSYKKVFEDIQSQVAKYDADLSLRKAEITRREDALNTQAAQITAQKAQMDALLQSGQTRAFNAQVESYNAAVNSYNVEVAAVKSLIDQYNQIVEQRNSLALQQQGLAQSLDSRLSPISQN